MYVVLLLFVGILGIAADFDIPDYGNLLGLPDGYVYFTGMGYYKFHTEGKTWFEAERVCSSEGAHLAIINTDSEALILSNLFNKHRNLSLPVNFLSLVGFHDIYKEDEFLTVNGEPLEKTGYTVWGDGEPNNSHEGNEDCGSISLEGKLVDVPCNAFAYTFICEIEPMKEMNIINQCRWKENWWIALVKAILINS